jgi:hypothetical protein
MSDKLAVTEKEIAAFFDPLTDVPEFKEKQLGRVATMANQIVAFDKNIADAERDLKVVKEQRRQLAEDLLPALMTENGLTEITLSDGSKVSVKKFYSCTIPADKTPLALEWLRDNGHDGLIKHRVTIDFTRDKDDQALVLKEELEDRGLYPSDKEWVEPSTLRGFAREQIEDGRNLPDTLFNLFIGERATIK